jgi:hypothetical protein
LEKANKTNDSHKVREKMDKLEAQVAEAAKRQSDAVSESAACVEQKELKQREKNDIDRECDQVSGNLVSSICCDLCLS